MIPNLFSKQNIPDNIPVNLRRKIREFSKDKDKKKFLERSFFYITKNWSGNRINLLLKFTRLFQKDVDKALRTKGYMHCTTMNFILRIMAIKSGLFTEKDIKLKMANSWYVAPHQYLEIRISNREKLTLDPWNYQYGIDYGKVGSGFDTMKIKPIR